MRKYRKILLCVFLAIGLVYTPVIIPQIANTQLVAEAEAATIKLNKKKATVAVGNTVKLKMTGTTKKVKWSSNNKKVATVTAKGVVKGKMPGTATIKAKVAGKTYKCKVTVKKSIFVSKKTVNISKAGKTAKVTVNIFGKGKVINNSSNRAVATSKWQYKWAGRTKNTLTITAKKPGTAYITLKNSYSKESLKIKVVVAEPVPMPEPEPTPEPEATPDVPVIPDTPEQADPMKSEMGQVKTANVEKAKAFADQLYNDSIADDYVSTYLPWEKSKGNSNWRYYTGLVHEGFLTLDFDRYRGETQKFYTQHIHANGDIKFYMFGELDSALPAVNMIRLLNHDTLSANERTQYEKAVNYAYHQLEAQTLYPEAGNLMLHSQNEDGTPKPFWTRWNICLDGLYMSQLFLIRAAEAIDAGNLTLISQDGTVVTSQEIWNDVYSRMTFIMENLRDPETGLLYHGYCVATGENNGVFWSRGMGWYAMALMEAALEMPDADKKAKLNQYYQELMTSVVNAQDKDSWLWYNVTDGRDEVAVWVEGERIANRPESSGSAMFAYSLLRGYHEGLLKEERFRAAGLCAFNALVETKLTEEGLTDVYSSSSVTTDRHRYQINGFVTNDGKGVGPFLMAIRYAY